MERSAHAHESVMQVVAQMMMMHFNQARNCLILLLERRSQMIKICQD